MINIFTSGGGEGGARPSRDSKGICGGALIAPLFFLLLRLFSMKMNILLTSQAGPTSTTAFGLSSIGTNFWRTRGSYILLSSDAKQVLKV